METLVPGQSAPFTQRSVVYTGVYDVSTPKSHPNGARPRLRTASGHRRQRYDPRSSCPLAAPLRYGP